MANIPDQPARFAGCLLGLAAGDADTTAAVCGQIAGAFYGVEGMPAHWRQRLAMREQIQDMAEALRVGGSEV